MVFFRSFTCTFIGREVYHNHSNSALDSMQLYLKCFFNAHLELTMWQCMCIHSVGGLNIKFNMQVRLTNGWPTLLIEYTKTAEAVKDVHNVVKFGDPVGKQSTFVSISKNFFSAPNIFEITICFELCFQNCCDHSKPIRSVYVYSFMERLPWLELGNCDRWVSWGSYSSLIPWNSLISFCHVSKINDVV